MERSRLRTGAGARAMLGLTLLELLTTMGLGGVLLAIAVPSFSNALERNRTATAVNRLLTDIARVRTGALTLHDGAVICPSVDARTCAGGTDYSGGWIGFRDRNEDGRLDAGEELIAVAQSIDLGERRVSTSSGRSIIRFRPDGRNAGTNLTLRVCDGQGVPLRLVIVNVGGRARVAPAAPSTAPCA